MKAISVPLDNITLIKSQLPDDLLQSLREEISQIENNFSNANLMISGLTSEGVPEHFFIVKNYENLRDYVLLLATEYQKQSSYFETISILTENLPFNVHTPWINFQKKNEFLPNHTHEGILSYVIWIRLPQSIETNKFSGKIEFTYTNILGQTVPSKISLDKSYEGTIIMFPAKLRHCVYPFYNSDEYRISISGNILLGF